MEKVNAITITAETPLRLHWVRVDASNMPSPVGDTEGFDPVVYDGSITPANGLLVTVRGLEQRVAVTDTQPPHSWNGRLLLLSERIRAMKAAGIYLPGFDGYTEWQSRNNPFATAGKVATAGEARLLAAIGVLDSKLDRMLSILKP